MAALTIGEGGLSIFSPVDQASDFASAVVKAAIDAVIVTVYDCLEFICGDLNGVE